MSSRPIQHLRVFQAIRQVDAAEVCRWRYPIALVLVAAIALLVQQLEFSRDFQGARVTLLLLSLVVVLAISQPWHRRLHVDMDTRTLRLEWRLLGAFAFSKNTVDLTGRQLGVGRSSFTYTQTQPNQNALGCAAFLLPFPFSLLAGGSDKKITRTGLRPVLAVVDLETGLVDELAVLAAPTVATEFLAAVREILPDCVKPADA